MLAADASSLHISAMAHNPRVYWKFGVVLRRQREAQGLSQRKLAALSGHDLPFVSSIERGRHNASLALADDLARVLGTSLGKMIAEAEKVRR
jgi:transcriptional regulator with XRE-family HTH domain